MYEVLNLTNTVILIVTFAKPCSKSNNNIIIIDSVVGKIKLQDIMLILF